MKTQYRLWYLVRDTGAFGLLKVLPHSDHNTVVGVSVQQFVTVIVCDEDTIFVRINIIGVDCVRIAVQYRKCTCSCIKSDGHTHCYNLLRYAVNIEL